MNWHTLPVSVKIQTPAGPIKLTGPELATLAARRLPGETPAQTYTRIHSH